MLLFCINFVDEQLTAMSQWLNIGPTDWLDAIRYTSQLMTMVKQYAEVRQQWSLLTVIMFCLNELYLWSFYRHHTYCCLTLSVSELYSYYFQHFWCFLQYLFATVRYELPDPIPSSHHQHRQDSLVLSVLVVWT